MAASGIAETGEWAAQFPGQRPPFSKGNAAARKHGAHDPRIVGPIAEKTIARFLASGDPPWIRHPLMQPVLRAYAIQHARTEILCEYLDNTGGWPWCPCDDCAAQGATLCRHPRNFGAWQAYMRASTREHYLLRDLGPEDPPRPGALWLQAASDYGYHRRKQPRDHNGRYTVTTVTRPW